MQGRQTYPPLKSLDDAVDFFVDQMYKNNIGVFGNRHLAASDYYGLSSKVSNELAKKNAEMVDFPVRFGSLLTNWRVTNVCRRQAYCRKSSPDRR